MTIGGLVLGGADAGNYVLSAPAPTTTASITPRQLVLDLQGQGSKVYDGTNTIDLGGITPSLSGVLGPDAVLLDAGLVTGFVDKNAGTGKAVTYTGFTLSGTDAGNYTLGSGAHATSTAVITPRSLTGITGITAADKIYDGTRQASLNWQSASLAGTVAGDILSVASATGAFQDLHVGSGKTVDISGLALGGADAGNYVLDPAIALTASATINARPIAEITGITAASKVYDGTTAVSLDLGTAVFRGLVAGDSLALAGGTGAFADKNAGMGKTITIGGLVLGGTSAGDYVLATPTATATADIAKASISSVSGITAAGKVYDGTRTASLGTGAVTFNGMVAGDTLTVASATGAFADKNAGSGKTVAIGGITLGGADAGNYELLSDSATAAADIAKARITSVSGITALDKNYDGTTRAQLSAGSATFAGLVPGDALAVVAARGTFASPSPGTHLPVYILGIELGGPDAGNYLLVDPTATAYATILGGDLPDPARRANLYDQASARRALLRLDDPILWSLDGPSGRVDATQSQPSAGLMALAAGGPAGRYTIVGSGLRLPEDLRPSRPPLASQPQ